MLELPAVIENCYARIPEWEARDAAIKKKWNGAAARFNRLLESLVKSGSAGFAGYGSHSHIILNRFMHEVLSLFGSEAQRRDSASFSSVDMVLEQLCTEISQKAKQSGLKRWLSGGPSPEQALTMIQELRSTVSLLKNELAQMLEAFNEAKQELMTGRWPWWKVVDEPNAEPFEINSLPSFLTSGRRSFSHKGIYFHFQASRDSDLLRTPSVVLAEALEGAKKKEAELLQAIDEAEDRERKEREKHGADDQTLAAAAAHFEKTRDLADTIKKRIRHQMHILPICPYCGGPLGDEPNADHIYPVNRGGLSTAENMVYVCAGCNNKKGDKTLREFMLAEGLNRDDVETRLTKLRKRF